jgi:hypothetical protein
METFSQAQELAEFSNTHTTSLAIGQTLLHALTENEAILINLHMLQEKFEAALCNGFLTTDQNSIELTAMRTRISALEIENRILIECLHKSQETLESQIELNHTSKIDTKKQNERIKALAEKLPEHWEADSFYAESELHDDKKTVTWNFRNLFIEDRLIPELTFVTELQKHDFRLKLLRSTEQTCRHAPLMRWPESLTEEDYMPCYPIPGGIHHGTNAALSELGTSDWAFILSLLMKLRSYLQNRSKAEMIISIDPMILQGVENTLNSLEAWPTMLRYDSFTTSENFNRKNYSALVCAMRNVSLGDRKWPTLDFVLSTVDNLEDTFGSNPRLEFAEVTANQPLSSWYAERDDEHGRRFELRFAHPDLMDIQVWKSISGSDQLLIAAIISSMPQMLHRAIHSSKTLLKSENKWATLAKSLRDNFVYNVIPASSQQH